jgi:hypothetical protein
MDRHPTAGLFFPELACSAEKNSKKRVDAALLSFVNQWRGGYDRSPEFSVSEGRTMHGTWVQPFLGFVASTVLFAPYGFAADEATASARSAEDLSREVDALLRQGWQAAGIEPAPRSSDAEFFRRLHLDLAGVIPAAEDAAAFIDDPSLDKRARAIGRLLDSPELARHVSTVLAGWILPRAPGNRGALREPFRAWLEQALVERRGWDAVVRDLIAATGSSHESPAVLFHAANGPTPEALAREVSRLFLGVQIQCAQCHDHPFTDWKQADFWSLAAFFSRTRRDKGSEKNVFVITDAPRPGKGKAPQGTGAGEAARGEVRLVTPSIRIPEQKNAQPVEGRFLDGTVPGLLPEAEFRLAAARWVTGKDNPYFPRITVNRVWSYLFGRGFVEPVDDFLPDSKPSHPEVLELLARSFVDSGYDLRFLLRAIAGTEAYQLTSASVASRTAADDARAIELFAVRTLRALSPEQLHDSLARATSAGGAAPGPSAPDAGAKGKKTGQRGEGGQRERVIALLASAEDKDSPQRYVGSIPVALFLMNAMDGGGGAIAGAKRSFVDAIYAQKPPPTHESAVEAMFLRAYGRRPDAEELATFAGYLREAEDARAAAQRAYWSLLNSAEFALNH